MLKLGRPFFDINIGHSLCSLATIFGHQYFPFFVPLSGDLGGVDLLIVKLVLRAILWGVDLLMAKLVFKAILRDVDLLIGKLVFRSVLRGVDLLIGKLVLRAGLGVC